MAFSERREKIFKFLKFLRSKPHRKPIPPAKPTSKPKTLFEEKKEWSRDVLRWKFKKSSPYIPGTGGKMYTERQREKMVDEEFPYKRFSSHISHDEAVKRLRELRKEEYQATTGKKKEEIRHKISKLEEFTGLKGKY